MTSRRRVMVWVLAVVAADGCGAAEHPASPPPGPPRATVEPASAPDELVLPDVAPRDVALHLDAPDGPVIGRLLAGAQLVAEERRGPFVQVRLDGVERPVASSGGTRASPLLAWIDARELSVPAAAPAGTTVRAIRDFYTRLQLTPQSGGFAWTACGPLRVVEERRDEAGRLMATRVAQARDGYELVGWSESPLGRRRGDHACPAQVIPAMRGMVLMPGQTPPAPEPLPAGFVEANMVPASRIAALARSQSFVYWIEETDEGAVCEGWRLAARGRATELEHDNRIDGGLSRTAYSVEVSDGRIVLLGPSTRWIRRPLGGGGGEMSFGCGDIYEMVAQDAERIVLLPGQHLGGVRGYRPEETESWFLTRDACESAVRRASSVDEALALAHKGC